MWTGQIAKTLDALVESGALVVGFDVVFTTSVERHIPGFDRAFRVALRRAGLKGKVVLAKVLHQTRSLRPFPGYGFAVGDRRNVRAANVFVDEDGVTRRVPLMLRAWEGDSGSRLEPTLSLEIAGRALGAAPALNGDGSVTLGRHRVPVGRHGGLLINYDSGAEPIPTYSLADVSACVGQDRKDYLQRHFAGKVVLFGAVLDVEDRKLTSKRFITAPEGAAQPERCVLPVMRELDRRNVRRDTIPGVYVQAAAITNLIRHNALGEAGFPGRASFDLAVNLLAGLGALLLSPLVASACTLAVAGAWVFAATTLFEFNLFVPVLSPLIGAVLTFTGVFTYRFTVADRDKRALRRSFSLYLPRQVVDRVVASDRVPELGGEIRELTLLFSDLAGFTGISENLSPQALVGLLNRYFAEMTEVIEAHGGIVDKYVGDGIAAIFGAPLDDPDHALHAVQAALACQLVTERLQTAAELPAGTELRTRIGINSGDVLVGNIGSPRRFNYTVMGDAVNLAARIEGANKEYGTAVLVSEATSRLCGDRMVLRKIDRVRVGRGAPVTLFEPMGAPGMVSPERLKQLDAFSEGLAHYRARRFGDAESLFAALADVDVVASRYCGRARNFAAHPPPDAWDGVFDLESK